MKENILVSVILSISHHPHLALRSVSSALNQGYSNLEVLVAADARHQETLQLIESLGDSRVRLLETASGLSHGAARNLAVHAAHGSWIAILEEGDEWAPEKLAVQMAKAGTLAGGHSVVGARCADRSRQADREDGTRDSGVYPRRLPQAGESIDLFLCYPVRFRACCESLSLSTLLAPRSLALAVPFTEELDCGDDLLWPVRAASLGQASFHVMAETLAVSDRRRVRTDRSSLSRRDWNAYRAIVRRSRLLFTPRAYVYCIVTRLLPGAIACGESFAAKASLLGECLGQEAAWLRGVFLFLYLWVTPSDFLSGPAESASWSGGRLPASPSRVSAA